MSKETIEEWIEAMPAEERGDLELLELVCQLHSRALNFPSDSMHFAYVKARVELENRLKKYASQFKEDKPMVKASELIQAQKELIDLLLSKPTLKEVDMDEYKKILLKISELKETTEDVPHIVRKIDTNKWYWCKCENCGWEDSSEFTKGGGQLADTGDYDDVLCPVCYSNKLEGEPTIQVPSYGGVVEVKIPFDIILTPYKKTIEEHYKQKDILEYQDLIEKMQAEDVPVDEEKAELRKRLTEQVKANLHYRKLYQIAKNKLTEFALKSASEDKPIEKTN